MVAGMLLLIVRPHRTKAGYSPQFEARLDDRRLVCISMEPLCAAARVLLAEGVEPSTRIAMRHAGADHDALASTVGAAAKLSVRESSAGDGPRFIRWEASPFRTVSPPVSFPEQERSDIGADADAS
jgi:hypothetical protein